MLKKFMLKNYKNFKDEITIDFENIAGYQFNTDCLSDGIIGKMLIYGRNATGKTNLGRAILDISSTMFGGTRYASNGILLNADSKEDSAMFQYEFRFEDTELSYKYSRLSNQELREEELSVNGKSIFKCNFGLREYNFDNLDDLLTRRTSAIERTLRQIESDEDLLGLDVYIEDGEDDEISEPKLPFLRWLISNVALKNDSALIRLSNYVRRMMMITVGNRMQYRFGRMNQGFYESLENPERLKDFEDFLNAMGIECKLVLKKLPDGQIELYFVHEQLVPFYENASSGTLALVELYRRLVPKIWDASLIYLDEFDAFYHYEMAENVICFFKQKYPKCQMIMTSHNTNLMTNRIMRPDCLFILSRKGTLTALCNATERELREGHNLEKMYISGEFEKYE